MKKIILIVSLVLFGIKSDCYKLSVITENIENQYLKVSIKNNSKKILAFYNGLYQTDFKIIDNNGKENIGEVTSAYSAEDYLDYQFDYSKSLIDKTMKKYSLSFKEAILYLHYKNKYVLIPPNHTKYFNLPIIHKNTTARYKLDSTRSYFLSISTIFSTEYIPEHVKDSLNSKNVEIIIPKINSDKININVDKFFRRHKNVYMK